MFSETSDRLAFFVSFSKQAGIRKGVGFHHPETFSSTSFFTMLKKLTEHNLKEKKTHAPSTGKQQTSQYKFTIIFLERESFYYQPKQRTIIEEIPGKNHPTFAYIGISLIPTPKMGPI